MSILRQVLRVGEGPSEVDRDMILCQAHFDKFHETISLNPTRKRKIERAQSNLDSFLNKHWFRAALAGDLVAQGSYASHTIVRPVHEDEEYDIDILLPIELSRIEAKVDQPADLLDLLQECLETYPDYEGKVVEKERCVRINYYGDFHIDLVPAAIDLEGCDGKPNGIVKIPDREENAWIPTNPIGRARWIHERHFGRTQFKLRRATKMLKHWRNVHIGDGLRSIVLSTLLALNNPGSPRRRTTSVELEFGRKSDALFLYDSVRMMLENAPGILDIRLENPTLPGEDLLRDVTYRQYASFLGHLEDLERGIEDALEASSQEEAIYQWKYLFGERFPKTI